MPSEEVQLFILMLLCLSNLRGSFWPVCYHTSDMEKRRKLRIYIFSYVRYLYMRPRVGKVSRSCPYHLLIGERERERERERDALLST